MYLLILDCCKSTSPFSIYLHSIMYLLILDVDPVICAASILFTFHNVSINSKRIYINDFQKYYLHSIMYLLIRAKNQRSIQPKNYLHSIMYLLIRTLHRIQQHRYLFTFHNVSINSNAV